MVETKPMDANLNSESDNNKNPKVRAGKADGGNQ